MEDSLRETITELRAARLKRGVLQADLAEHLGTTQSAVARLEAARSDPRLSTVHRYAEAVGLHLVLVPTGSRQASLVHTAEAVRAALATADADEALRNVIQFLDDVARLPAEARFSSVREEPLPVGSRRWDALLAGAAEYVSNRFGFPVPGWATAPSRFLRQFWFVVEDILGRPAPGLAASAFVRSPAELASRGVFLDAHSLVSV